LRSADGSNWVAESRFDGEVVAIGAHPDGVLASDGQLLHFLDDHGSWREFALAIGIRRFTDNGELVGVGQSAGSGSGVVVDVDRCSPTSNH
jgi:hypothetical protein